MQREDEEGEARFEERVKFEIKEQKRGKSPRTVEMSEFDVIACVPLPTTKTVFTK